MIPVTQEEADKLNAETEAELKAELQEEAEAKQVIVNKSLQHLLNVVQAETIDVKFKTSGQEAVLKIKANPSQKVMRELARISQDAETGNTDQEDEERLCHILESLCIDPVIPFELWKSGEVPDEVPAKIIVELMKHKATKQIEMEEDVSTFRENYRRSKTARNGGTSGETTE